MAAGDTFVDPQGSFDVFPRQPRQAKHHEHQRRKGPVVVGPHLVRGQPIQGKQRLVPQVGAIRHQADGNQWLERQHPADQAAARRKKDDQRSAQHRHRGVEAGEGRVFAKGKKRIGDQHNAHYRQCPIHAA